jgi:hypothetical protein
VRFGQSVAVYCKNHSNIRCGQSADGTHSYRSDETGSVLTVATSNVGHKHQGPRWGCINFFAVKKTCLSVSHKYRFRRVRRIAKSDLALLCPPISPDGTTRLARRIFMKFYYFSKMCRENSSFIKIGHEDQYTFFIISRALLRRMKSISDKLL